MRRIKISSVFGWDLLIGGMVTTSVLLCATNTTKLFCAYMQQSLTNPVKHAILLIANILLLFKRG